MTEKISVHRALIEKKLLKARIEKASEMLYVMHNKHSNTKIGGVEVQTLQQQMKENYQSLNTLIDRYNAISKAVVLSNANTDVIINNVKYTVAEAIQLKNEEILFTKNILQKMTKQYNFSKTQCDLNNGEHLDTRAEEYLSAAFGTDTKSDVKTLNEVQQKARQEFITAQTYELVDPLDIYNEMQKLDNKINDFLGEVDSCLSVSNAVTEIEFTY